MKTYLNKYEELRLSPTLPSCPESTPNFKSRLAVAVDMILNSRIYSFLVKLRKEIGLALYLISVNPCNLWTKKKLAPW